MTSISVARVVAPRRDLDVVVVADRRGGEADRVEHLRDARRAQVGAEEPGHSSRAQAHRRAFREGAGGDRSTVLEGGAEQVGEPAHGQVDDLGIGPLLEPSRGLRAELVATRRLHDADRVEPGHLQQHVGGGVVDLAGGAAHDPGQADRHVVAVADEQVLGGEAPLDVVEGGERLVLAGHAHPEPGAGDLGEVVRVVRLPELEHDVVRHVDDVADRPHAEQREASGQLGIARPDRDVAEDASLEAPAAVGVEDLDGHRADAVSRRRRPATGPAARRAAGGERPGRARRRRSTWRRAGWG